MKWQRERMPVNGGKDIMVYTARYRSLRATIENRPRRAEVLLEAKCTRTDENGKQRVYWEPAYRFTCKTLHEAKEQAEMYMKAILYNWHACVIHKK